MGLDEKEGERGAGSRKWRVELRVGRGVEGPTQYLLLCMSFWTLIIK
jgi:hypothetical protein